MNTQFFIGTCFVLGALGTWNTWTLHQVTKRLDKIEARETSEAPISTSVSKNKRAYKNLVQRDTSSARQAQAYVSSSDKARVKKDTTSDNAIDLSDPSIREAIAKIAQDDVQKKEQQRRKSKMEAYKTSIQHELEKFSSEKGYDVDTTQKVEVILDESSSEWVAIRQQVREGEISWLDARTEFKAIGDDTESKVTEIISEEDYKELRSRLWGQWD